MGLHADQIGDRGNFLTNPRISGTRVVSQPRDRYSPKQLLGNDADPTIPTGLAWTFRPQYSAYPAVAGVPQKQTASEVQLRNTPIFDINNAGYDASNNN